MENNKDRLAFKRKILKNIRSHLAKRVIFSINLKNTKGIHQEKSTVEHYLLVLSENSKIDLSDANNVIRHFSNVRTYRDLDLKLCKTKNGIEIQYKYHDETYIIKIHIFRFIDLSSTKLVGCQTSNGFEYTWVDIIDYQKHPSVFDESNIIHFHRTVTKLIYNDINIIDGIDWTLLIEMDKVECTTNKCSFTRI